MNADNLEILLSHLKCAAFELPLRTGELFGTHDSTDLCRFLSESGFLHNSGDLWHWTSDSYPADTVSLRAVSSDNFVVIDITGEAKVIADVSFTTALTTLHEKAIYLHEAKQFHVEHFDYKERKAYVKRVDCDYYTDAIDYTEVAPLRSFETEPSGRAQRVQGDVRVNRQIVGFKKIKFYTLENVGAGKLQMPEQEMHTTSYWLDFPASVLEALPFTPVERQNGITGLANALRTVASLLLMCDPRDLGVSATAHGNLSLRCLPGRYRPECTALPHACGPGTPHGGADLRLPLRTRLPGLRRALRGSRRAGKTGCWSAPPSALLRKHSSTYPRNPRFFTGKFARFGNTVVSPLPAPNHVASVAPYWSTEVVGIQRPSPASSPVPNAKVGNLP